MTELDEQIILIREATLAGDLSELEFVREVEALIDKRETEARINELGYVQLEYGGRFIATTYADGDGQDIMARIEDLKEALSAKHSSKEDA